MKKIISVCLCIGLMSGCDKLLRHGRPVNAVAEDTGSKAPHSLASNTSKASAPEPSNTPAPTPEPSKSVPSASGAPDIVSLVKKYVVNAVLCAVALAVIFGGYKLLYRFADINPISMNNLNNLKVFTSMKLYYAPCYFQDGHFFSVVSSRYVDEIPFKIDGFESVYFYIPNPPKLKPLLRKIFRIKIPVSEFF
ncbi:MAG: hypothetical protein LE169_04670 [Endomicrobium sp.]|nr:hypothetical protein [Endomicrobium sp.]